MKKKRFFNDYITVADNEANRINMAIAELEKQLPITPLMLQQANIHFLGILELLTGRFGKLQDVIGDKIFPLLLEHLQEKAPAMLDKLHKLEKLEYLPDVYWWIELRNIQNSIVHEYPDNALLSEHLNGLIPQAKNLLQYWQELKNKILLLISPNFN